MSQRQFKFAAIENCGSKSKPRLAFLAPNHPNIGVHLVLIHAKMQRDVNIGMSKILDPHGDVPYLLSLGTDGHSIKTEYLKTHR